MNGQLSPSFPSKKGLKQGDNLSPNFFSAFINDLILQLNKSGLGVTINHCTKICVLAYADDIVLLGETAEQLQTLLKIVQDWCRDWCVLVNTTKMKIMHFRKRNKVETQTEFSE